MIVIKANQFSISRMPDVVFQITYADIDSESPLNQHEPHIHKECEIYLNLSGDVSFEVERHIYPIKRGSVIITRPYEYHHCIYHSSKPHRHYWITFSANGNEDFLEIFYNREKGNDNLLILEDNDCNELCEVLEELLKNRTTSLQRRIDFLRIFSILSRGKPECEVEISKDSLADVRIVLQYMEEHLTEDVNIKKIADACNMSINTLERRFKETLYISPSMMLRKKRLIASMRYLRMGNSVCEAALKSGFSDYSNYIQLFKKQFGLTPLQYKKMFK